MLEPHSCQTGSARTTHEVNQHRFGLVVSCVAGEHVGWQCRKTRVARPSLEVRPRFNGHHPKFGRSPESLGNVTNEVKIVGGVSPKTVVYVPCGDWPSRSNGEEEKGERVGSTRDSTVKMVYLRERAPFK
jgi:hypothetical protein